MSGRIGQKPKLFEVNTKPSYIDMKATRNPKKIDAYFKGIKNIYIYIYSTVLSCETTLCTLFERKRVTKNDKENSLVQCKFLKF